jgi:putative flavoprotein involved in K+ transport
VENGRLKDMSESETSVTRENVSAERPRDRFDVVVIGAGQAGLAIGHFLAEQGRRFVIVEAADSIGSAWRSRWDSLLLFTPRRYDALPGLVFPGNPDGYPTRDEVVAYLERYAAHFRLPIELSSRVRSLRKDGDAFVLEAGEKRIVADQVVVATGPFQVPNTPVLAGGLADGLFQVHSADYCRPADIPEGRVLVVGGGNTGFQIAKELAASRREEHRSRSAHNERQRGSRVAMEHHQHHHDHESRRGDRHLPDRYRRPSAGGTDSGCEPR